MNIEQLEKALIGKSFIQKIIYFDEIDSTNEYAKNLNQDNVLILTEYQSKGKGRFDKTWSSEKRKNILLSIRKKFDTNENADSWIMYSTCLSIYKTIGDVLHNSGKDDSEIKIKWPNDILLDRKKVSGILIETRDRKNFVIGIGLNVNEKFSESSNLDAISLCNYSSKELVREDIISNLISHLEKYLIETDKLKIFTEWKSKNFIIGNNVNAFIEGRYVDAQVKDILEDGAILVSINNKIFKYYSNEVPLRIIN